MSLEGIFPGLSQFGYQITSEKTPDYNCIAWAVGVTEAWWWPDPMYQYYWPPEIARSESVEAFVAAFGTLGYSECPSPDLEIGFEKIALFVDQRGVPTHAARQRSDGSWTSKLGELEDIGHVQLEAVSGYAYGSARVFMKRPGAS
jgi:hypothetical protein